MNGNGGGPRQRRQIDPERLSESVPTLPQPAGEGGDAPEVESGDSEALRTALLPGRPSTGHEEHDTEKPSPEEPPVGSVIAGRYELLRRVAGGSMGVVYKALDRQATLSSHEPAWVALKLLKASLGRHGPALRALQREAQTGLALDHPNIVRFHGLERDNDRFFIVMEWLPGRSLAEWMDGHPGESMPMAEVLRLLRELGAALDYAHEQGVVHADVKPGNVMLLPDGSVRLCDFGIARFDKLLATRTGSFDPSVLRAATPAYSSPEVLRGDNPQVEDDVYSLACLTYRLLAGRRVFGRRDAAEADEAGDTAAPVDGLDAARWEALRRGLSLSRSGRQPSVRQFVTQFAGTEAPPLGSGRARVAAVSAVVVVLALAAAWIFVNRDLPWVGTPGAAGTKPSVVVRPPPPASAQESPLESTPDSTMASPLEAPVVASPETAGTGAPGETDQARGPVPEPARAAVADAPLAEARSGDTAADGVPPDPPDKEAARPPALPGVGADAVGFTSERIFVSEDGTVIRVELIRYNAGGQRRPFVLGYGGGTAEPGEDFILPRPASMVFAPDQTAVTLYLPVIDDAVAEPTEFFLLTLDDGAAGLVTELLVEIGDDD